MGVRWLRYQLPRSAYRATYSRVVAGASYRATYRPHRHPHTGSTYGMGIHTAHTEKAYARGIRGPHTAGTYGERVDGEAAWL